MNIQLPNRYSNKPPINIDSNAVVIGANGSGKTRFANDIESRYKNIIRISPANFSDNFRHLIQNLIHDEKRFRSGKTGYSYFNALRLIWEKVIKNRSLRIEHKKLINVDTLDKNHIYHINEMGDAEKLLLYVIGTILYSPRHSLILVDEPEMHINKATIIKLWDLLEKNRSDCQFLYLTHNVAFASSRHDFTKIWLKEHNGNLWNYELLEAEIPLPDKLYFELLRDRKTVLFIEGDSVNSIDFKLLQPVFPDFLIKPLGSCNRVLSTTKTMNEQKVFHDLNSFGLVDRDRRSYSQIEHLQNANIWVTQVAEIENFLLIENIVKTVAKVQNKNSDAVFSQVKNNVITFFREEVENQAMEHSLAKIDRIFSTLIGHSKGKTFHDFEQRIEKFWEEKNFSNIYNKFLHQFKTMIKEENYQAILQVFNNKGIIARSNVISLCNIIPRTNYYLHKIIDIMKENNEDSEIIKQAIIANIAMASPT